jgi:hypothetical protein
MQGENWERKLEGDAWMCTGNELLILQGGRI